ncbi:thioesterase family protein [Streptomyces sp. 2A115]|uniref:thioesterase family protein n=1 Tax=Streptomyces sp. 2A115 TaxID=3457439 RepID=UPI003FD5342A
MNHTAEFDQAISLSRTEDPSGYRADLGDGWRFGTSILGGLLMALAGRALSEDLGKASGHGDPVSVSAHFLSRSLPGPATVRTETLRQGRTVSSGMASIKQGDHERVRVVATFADLAGKTTAKPAWAFSAPPNMPPPEKCVGSEMAPPSLLKEAPFLDRVDLRLAPECVGWALGAPSGQATMQGWLRLPDDRAPDPLMLLLAVDCLPPVSLDLGIPGWAPTLELTTHIRALPAPGWLRLRHSTTLVDNDFMEEDAEVWDSTDRLVAQSRQLTRLGRPDS